MARQEETNYFAVMGLAPNATEVDIRKAYRKLSLALHPDKNRSMDPELASARFHEMQLAYEVLMDPAARLAAAERNKVEELRRERRGAYEGKRKEMAEELEKREEEERLKRFRGAQDEQKRKATLEKLREEGRRLREEKEKKAMEQERRLKQEVGHIRQWTMQHSDVSEAFTMPEANRERMPELGPLDLTVRLRFPEDQYADLTASASTASPLESPLARGLEYRFGKLDSLIIKQPKAEREGKKKSKEITAHATFKTLDAAFAAVKAGSQLRAGGDGPAACLEDVWIGWAAGPRNGNKMADSNSSGEPERITWLRRNNKLESENGDREASDQYSIPKAEDDVLVRMKGASAMSNGVANGKAAHGTNLKMPSPNDSPRNDRAALPTTSSDEASEMSILQRMREAERKRMEEAILKMDAQ